MIPRRVATQEQTFEELAIEAGKAMLMNRPFSNHRTTTLVALVSLTIMSALASLARAATPDTAPNPRDLPSVVEKWKWTGEADFLAIGSSRVYVGSGRTLFALDAKTGSELWKRDVIADDSLYGATLVETSGPLALASRETLVLIDPATGAVVANIDLGDYIAALTGPELVAGLSPEDGPARLVGIDPATGAIRARRILTGDVRGLAQEDGIVAALVDVEDGTYQYQALGFRAATLEPAWEGPITQSLDFERFEGVTYVELKSEEDDRPRLTAIDVGTGHVGKQLPALPECSYQGGNLPWDAQVVEIRDDRGLSQFRRNDKATGSTRWLIDLPCVPGNVLRLGDELLVDCRRAAGLDVFFVLDWQTGAVLRQLAGYANMESLEKSNDLVIAHAQDRVVAFSPAESGPPASRTTSIKDEVHRILANSSGDESRYGQAYAAADRVSELKSLGPGAYPFIVAEVPAIGPTSLGAAAVVLMDGGFREGASALAARLPALAAKGTPGVAKIAVEQVLDSLSSIGGDSEVEIVATLLLDAAGENWVRRKSFTTLASIGTPRSLEIAKRALASAVERKHPSWTPPAPDFLDLVGTEIDDRQLQEAEKRNDYLERGRLESARASAVASEAGRSVIVFPDSDLGSNRDIWAIERSSGGDSSGHVTFLGMLPSFNSWDDDVLEASLVRNTLIVGVKGKANSRVRFDLRAAARDSDKDGLPDTVESRLRTDPNSADSDGDGLNDSADPMPNAARSASGSATPEQAVFTQFFAFESPSRELAVLVQPSPMEWRGRHAPTISLDPAKVDVLREELGQNGVGYIRVGAPMTPDTRPAKPGELVYEISIYRGGLNAVGYRVTLQKFGVDWLMTSVAMSWIS